MLNIHNLRDTTEWKWYGEGDDMIFIDGDQWPPTLHGTGTEDYFNTASTGGTSAALPVRSGYASLMIEERGEQLPQTSEPASTASEDMAEALAAAKASSPSLGAALDAAGVKPDELADAHERATADEHEGTGPAAG